ncbi:hypothetical protein OROGR_008103 [Orobanche gracilis]
MKQPPYRNKWSAYILPSSDPALSGIYWRRSCISGAPEICPRTSRQNRQPIYHDGIFICFTAQP